MKKPFLPVFFHRMHKRMMEEHTKILENHELTRVHVPFIFLLSENEKGLYQSELARKLDFNRAHISRTLKDLEERGFVVQENDSGYKNKYFITDKGESIAHEMKIAGKNIQKHVFSVLSDDEIVEFERIVKKMTDAL